MSYLAVPPCDPSCILHLTAFTLLWLTCVTFFVALSRVLLAYPFSTYVVFSLGLPPTRPLRVRERPFACCACPQRLASGALLTWPPLYFSPVPSALKLAFAPSFFPYTSFMRPRTLATRGGLQRGGLCIPTMTALPIFFAGSWLRLAIFGSAFALLRPCPPRFLAPPNPSLALFLKRLCTSVSRPSPASPAEHSSRPPTLCSSSLPPSYSRIFPPA